MELLVGFFLILTAGFFAGSETAVYRSNWIRLTNWASHNIPGAKSALQLLDRRETTVVVTLVGTNLCIVFATVLFSHFFEARYGPAYATVAVVLVIVLTIILGEYVPKAIAQAFPDRWLRQTVLPLSISRVVFAPVVFVLSGIARLLAGPMLRAPRSSFGDSSTFTLTRQDFLAALRKRDAESGSARLVTSMVSRLFRFSGMKVSEVCIPLSQVKAVPHDAGLNGVLAVINEYGFSRIPVYQGDLAHITGVIVAKDLLAAPAWRVRKIPRVNETDRAMEVLRLMQRRGEHLAVVEDANHAVTGIVSLEDLLEELVGEIRSEG
ncbi:MAG: CNNM domain-containing protein [candidate division WOR-3 bacterium]|nr:CNNM domain-containing protein [candidate division WOR-3 bacterium]